MIDNNGSKSERDGQPTAAEKFRLDLQKSNESLHGRPGRRKKDDSPNVPSLSQLDRDRLNPKGGQDPVKSRGVSRATRYLWETGQSIPRPEKFGDHLIQAGETGAKAIPHLESYVPAYFEHQTERLAKGIEPALVGEDGDVAILDIETQTRLRSVIISTSGRPRKGELEEARRLMESSVDAFGWVTLGPSLQVVSPSRPICRLLRISPAELDGTSLIDDPLLSALEALLGNYGEWLLIIAMMVDSLEKQWRQSGLHQEIERAERFFGRVSDYVADNPQAVADQIAATPEIVVDHIPREVLQECYRAAQGLHAWPAFKHGGWNTMRMHVARHDLLPQGAVARFAKRSWPIPLESPLGFQVWWDDEHADAAANQLRRAILRDLESSK
jgi:hypothetical protein